MVPNSPSHSPPARTLFTVLVVSALFPYYFGGMRRYPLPATSPQDTFLYSDRSPAEAPMRKLITSTLIGVALLGTAASSFAPRAHAAPEPSIVPVSWELNFQHG